MELLLNIVWLLIGGVALWSFLGSASKDRRQFLVALLALTCAILVLYPAISASDDVNFQAVVSEDSNSSKRLMSADSNLIPAFIAQLITGLLTGLLPLWIIRKTKSIARLSALFERPVLGRAPPAFALA